jgi:hypothetical protein
MKWSELPLRPTPRMLRQFAAAWFVFFLCLGVHQYFVRNHPAPGLALGAAAIVVGGLGLVKPAAIRWLYIGATVLAFPMGWVVSQLMLAVMFYGVLTPIALCLRLSGRDPLRRRPAPGCASHWQPRDAPPEARRYLRQY